MAPGEAGVHPLLSAPLQYRRQLLGRRARIAHHEAKRLPRPQRTVRDGDRVALGVDAHDVAHEQIARLEVALGGIGRDADERAALEQRALVRVELFDQLEHQLRGRASAQSRDLVLLARGDDQRLANRAAALAHDRPQLDIPFDGDGERAPVEGFGVVEQPALARAEPAARHAAADGDARELASQGGEIGLHREREGIAEKHDSGALGIVEPGRAGERDALVVHRGVEVVHAHPRPRQPRGPERERWLLFDLPRAPDDAGAATARDRGGSRGARQSAREFFGRVHVVGRAEREQEIRGLAAELALEFGDRFAHRVDGLGGGREGAGEARLGGGHGRRRNRSIGRWRVAGWTVELSRLDAVRGDAGSRPSPCSDPSMVDPEGHPAAGWTEPERSATRAL